jgi:hypothetical protein
VPVAAGETLDASAWVKLSNVVGEESDEGSGNVALVANFFEGDGRSEDFQDIATIAAGADDWCDLHGQVTVPKQARGGAPAVGLRYIARHLLGAMMFRFPARRQLVARADLDDERMTPQLGGVPITVINRSQAPAKAQVRWRSAVHRLCCRG